MHLVVVSQAVVRYGVLWCAMVLLTWWVLWSVRTGWADSTDRLGVAGRRSGRRLERMSVAPTVRWRMATLFHNRVLEYGTKTVRMS